MTRSRPAERRHGVAPDFPTTPASSHGALRKCWLAGCGILRWPATVQIPPRRWPALSGRLSSVFLRAPARGAARYPQNRPKSWVCPRSRRGLPRVRVSSARSRHHPCRARSGCVHLHCRALPSRRRASLRPARGFSGACTVCHGRPRPVTARSRASQGTPIKTR